MFDLLQYLPIAFKLMKHKEEINRVMELLAPAIKEVQKAAPEVIPMVKTIAVDVFPELQAQINGSAAIATFDVRWLKESLNVLGEHLIVNESDDQATHEAVKRFQLARGFVGKDIDGWAGLQTVLELGVALAEKKKAKP